LHLLERVMDAQQGEGHAKLVDQRLVEQANDAT
jgi:hypothetical protein